MLQNDFPHRALVSNVDDALAHMGARVCSDPATALVMAAHGNTVRMFDLAAVQHAVITRILGM